MLVSSVSVADHGYADGPEEETATFDELISDQVLTGIDAVSDAVSKRADNLLLPPGAAIVLDAIVEDETSEPQAAAVTGPVTYNTDAELEELRLAEGADITIYDGVTVAVDRLYIESAGNPIYLTTVGTGHMTIGLLVIEGLVIPLPQITVSADAASIETEFQRNGDERSFSLKVMYNNDIRVTLGGNTIVYSSEDPGEIRISVDLDLTDYTSHVGAPGTFSTIERLFRYVGSLDLVRLDVGIRVGGSYGIEDYPLPFRISDLELTINSHKDSDVPYYGIGLSLGNVRTYPVDITNMLISMDLPASRMKDGNRPSMDRAREFNLSADAIAVERIEPDDPLNVTVSGLAIGITAEPEPGLSLAMDEMAYLETLSDEKGTFDVGTVVTGFDMDFKGTASDLLDDARSLIKKIIAGTAVEGGISLGGVEFSRYDVNGHAMAESVSIDGLEVKVKLAIPQFSMSIDMGSLEYNDAARHFSCASLGYDLWLGIDTSLSPDTSNLRDMLKLFAFRSVVRVTAEENPDYHFTIDQGRAFMTKFATDGLRAVCGNDTVTFDQDSVKGLVSGGDIEIRYSRLTADEIKDKVPGKVRDRLNGGAVIELSNSSNIVNLDGEAEVSVSTDLNEDGAGAYYINTDRGTLEDRDYTVGDGHISFRTDRMGLHAVSGPLTKPDRTVLAWGLVIGAGVLGVVTVLIGRRLLTKGV